MNRDYVDRLIYLFVFPYLLLVDGELLPYLRPSGKAEAPLPSVGLVQPAHGPSPASNFTNRPHPSFARLGHFATPALNDFGGDRFLRPFRAHTWPDFTAFVHDTKKKDETTRLVETRVVCFFVPQFQAGRSVFVFHDAHQARTYIKG